MREQIADREEPSTKGGEDLYAKYYDLKTLGSVNE